MPELPEVETIRRDLERHLSGVRVAGVRVLRPEVVVGATPAALDRALRGARFHRFTRRGKYLIVEFARDGDGASRQDEPAGGRRWLVIHLRMTGRLTLARREEPLPPHTHVIVELAGDPHRGPAGSNPAGPVPWDELRFSDVRRFGRLYLLDKDPLAPGPREAGRGAGAGRTGPVPGLEGLRTLGPEPLGPRFSAAELARRLAGRRAPIKALLLDQRVVAGLGNIYADEALFRARIHPARSAGQLAGREVARLVRAIRAVLREAVDAGGTTFSDYRDGLGRQGRFARRLAVYDRAGEPCPRCGTPIATLRLGGRTAHFCPRCQPASAPPDGGPRQRGAVHGPGEGPDRPAHAADEPAGAR
ncbi:MAG TPA: bifunctional DNA-formamidopyrimidine glycosylase/DNA-(apurinic or apyrimidinic site) lyase [Thermaerobacter sp.]